MSSKIAVTFLGTTSGGGPTETRNCSSLVVEPLGDGHLWMVDCAEGTVRQFAQQPFRPRGEEGRRLRISQVNKIFITHMHADHCMGVLTVLRNALGIPRPPSAIPTDAPPPNASRPHVEIYGPRGVRRMLRTLWHLTHTHSEHAFAVHELLFQGETPSVPADVPDEPGADEASVRRESECVGRDIWCDAQGFWHGVVEVPATRHGSGALVDAGPIEHRDPCIGYIIRELPQYALAPSSPLPRKLVILGDTYDPSRLIPLIFADPPFADGLPELNTSLHLDPADVGEVRVPVSLLVHEATDAYLPPRVDREQRTGKNRTEASVEAKTRERGHSTPAMAGAFAKRIGAKRLVLNHIGARFPAPGYNAARTAQDSFRLRCMQEIERQAEVAWAPQGRVRPQAAWDFLVVTIPPNPPRRVEELGAPAESMRENAEGYGTAAGGSGRAAVKEELPTEVEMEDATSTYGSRGREQGAAEPFGTSAESMGARHDRERGYQDRKRDREWSSGRGESSSGGGRGGSGGSGGGRGGYESRRGYGTSSGRDGGGGGYGGGRDRGRGDGGRGGGGGNGGHGGSRGGYKRARG